MQVFYLYDPHLMDELQFTSEIFKAAAWPIVVLAIALVYRKEFQRLLNRLRSLEGPAGTKAAFIEELNAVAVQASKTMAAESLGNVARFGTPSVAETPAPYSEQPIETHYDSPRWRIMDAYSSVESAMQKLIHLGGLTKHHDSEGPSVYAWTLLKEGVIDRSTMELIQRLRVLRDQALTSEVEPERQHADTFYVAARSVYRTLAMKMHEMILEREEQMRSTS